MVVGGSLLFLGACSPRSEPSVSPPQAQQSPASQPITGQEANRVPDPRSQRGNEQNPRLNAYPPHADGARIPRAGPDGDCVYAIKPAPKGRHWLP